MSIAAVLLEAAELLEKGADAAPSPSEIKSESPDAIVPENSVKNREVHNLLEKNRRAHLKQCFSDLKIAVPTITSNKISTVSILQHASEYIVALRTKHDDYAREMERLKKAKQDALARLAALRTKRRDSVSSVGGDSTGAAPLSPQPSLSLNPDGDAPSPSSHVDIEGLSDADEMSEGLVPSSPRDDADGGLSPPTGAATGKNRLKRLQKKTLPI
eukprot:Opistho-2@91443